jgi:GNAT superfamily N-acetyltransferase
MLRAMADPSRFSASEQLRNGAQILIRALRPGDRQGLLHAAARASDQSLYRRFFGVRRAFSDAEVTAFVDVDFSTQVALVAVSQEAGREDIVGGARYIVVRPGIAEIAFLVIDEFQRQGLASALLRHLAGLARACGISAFIAEVLPANSAMLQVLERSGLRLQISRERDVVHVTAELG